MPGNDTPQREPTAEARSRLPVPVDQAGVPVDPRASRFGTALERVRPALPVLVRGAAIAATLTAGALVAARAGGRLRPLPLPTLPVPPSAPGSLVPRQLPSQGETVIVTRMFTSWSYVQVYRHPARPR
jgi:hypothetical protein